MTILIFLKIKIVKLIMQWNLNTIHFILINNNNNNNNNNKCSIFKNNYLKNIKKSRIHISRINNL